MDIPGGPIVGGGGVTVSSMTMHNGRLLVRYQKKEQGSKNVNPTKLERFMDKVKFLYKTC